MPIRAIMYIRLLIIVNTYDKLLYIAEHATPFTMIASILNIYMFASYSPES